MKKIGVALLTVAACACTTDPPEALQPSEAVADDAPAPLMKAHSDGPFHDDGTLRPAEEQVLGAPIPREMAGVSGSDSWAGYQAPYGYRTLVDFYADELGSDWKPTRSAGGVKFQNEKTGGAVYVQKPRDSAQKPRVFYFGESDGVARPPSGLAQEATPPAGSAGGANPSGAAGQGQGGGGHYNKSVQKRDGKDVVVYTPKEERDAVGGGRRDDLSRYERGPEFNPFAGPRVKSKVPEGVLH